MLIIQLFDLVSNCNTGEAVHTNTMELICISRGSTRETFSLSHLLTRKQIYGLFVFLHWKPQTGCCKHEVTEKTSTGDGVFSYLGLRFDFSVLGRLKKKSWSFFFLYCFFCSTAFWRQIFHKSSLIKPVCHA